jgi:adenylate kinase
MAKKLVIIMGHNGSGKSTLVATLQSSKKYKVVNLGEVMHELAREKKLVKQPDQIKDLAENVQEDLRNEAVKYVSRMPGNVVLDTHSTVEQHGRFLPGLHHYVTDQLRHVSGFLYIDADPGTILKRTNKDRKEEWSISMQKNINLAILSYHAAQLGVPLYVVSNDEGELWQAQEQVSKHIDSIFTS